MLASEPLMGKIVSTELRDEGNGKRRQPKNIYMHMGIHVCGSEVAYWSPEEPRSSISTFLGGGSQARSTLTDVMLFADTSQREKLTDL